MFKSDCWNDSWASTHPQCYINKRRSDPRSPKGPKVGRYRPFDGFCRAPKSCLYLGIILVRDMLVPADPENRKENRVESRVHREFQTILEFWANKDIVTGEQAASKFSLLPIGETAFHSFTRSFGIVGSPSPEIRSHTLETHHSHAIGIQHDGVQSLCK
jgi:hypothetical protein